MSNLDDFSLEAFEKVTCPICGAEMIETNRKAKCFFCGKEENADYLCPNGHYICQECRVSSPEEISTKVVNHLKTTNPLEIAERILLHPNVPIYGVEHHYIVPLSLVAAAYNAQGKTIRKGIINTIMIRAKHIPYGACGLLGACGASVGVGIAISVLTHASYKSDVPRALSMKATASTLLDLARQGGLRCCIQSVYSAIKVGSKIIREELKIQIEEIRNIKCIFYDKAPECKKERCEYYPLINKK
ncbi:MAG: DUF5714 domain-containing protein [Candidatus Asgardarchaeia archaeon]